LQWTIAGNEHDTIENINHFCEILLQVWSERGRKDHFRSEFNAKTLAKYQIGDDRIYRKTRLNSVIGSELEREIYSCD